MNLRTVNNLLNDINDGLLLGYGKRITREVIEAHHAVLVDVSDDYYSRIKLQVIRTWKYNSMPKPAHLREIYEQLNPPKEGTYDSGYKSELKDERRKYNTLKSKYQVDVVDFVKKIINDGHLTHSQKDAYKLILKYMRFHGVDRKPEEELKTMNSAYSISFTGLYMFWLQGELGEITGEDFNGNVPDMSRVKKPYNEKEYSKDKKRQRSLDLEKNRELGIG